MELKPETLTVAFELICSCQIQPSDPQFINKAIQLENAKNDVLNAIQEHNTKAQLKQGEQVLDTQAPKVKTPKKPKAAPASKVSAPVEKEKP